MLTAIKMKEFVLTCFILIGISHGQVSPPNDFTRSEIRSTSFVMTWTMDPGVNYKIDVVLDGESNSVMPTNTGTFTSPFKVTQTTSGDDVMPNTAYNIRLFAINPADEIDFASVDIPGLITAVPAPTNVQISNVGSTQFDVTWDFTNNPANGDLHQAVKYILTYTPDGGIGMTQDVMKRVTTITGLTPNTDYTVSVVGWTSDEIFTDDSAPNSQSTISDQQVSGIATSRIRSTSISLTWNAVAGSSSSLTYTVSWNPASADGTTTSMSGITTTSTTIDGLTSNTEYTFTVTALHDGGNGMPSDSVSFFTAAPAPTNVQISNVGSTQFDVTWDFTNNPANGDLHQVSKYVLTYTPDGGTSMTQDGIAKFTTLTGLTPNTDYTVSVVAWTSDEIFTDDSVPSTQPTTSPQQVDDVATSRIRSTSISLTWNAVAGSSSSLTYTVSWNPAYADGTTTMSGITTTSTTIDGLTSNTEYTFTVTASSDGGNGMPSDSVSFFTAAPAPTNVQISNVGSTQFDVTWDFTNNDANGGFHQAVKYILTYTPDGGIGMTQDVMKRMTTITGLTPNTDYTVSVVAWTSDEIFTDDSVPSTQPTTNIGPPTSLNVVSSTSTTIDVTWMAPSGGNAVIITGYLVSWTPPDDTGSMSITDGSTSATITGLNSNTEYTIMVAAQSSASDGEVSDSTKGITASYKSDKPTSIMAISTTSSTIAVSWFPPIDESIYEEVTGYIVSWESTFESKLATVYSDTTSIEISNLSPNTLYNITITTQYFNVNGDSDETTAVTILGKSDNVTITSSTASTISLMWIQPYIGGDAASITGYVITWSPPHSGGYKEITQAKTRSTKIFGLISNLQYSVVVAAKTLISSGEFSDPVKSLTVPGSPSKPRLTTPITSENSIPTIQVDWTKPDGGYDIDYYVVEWWPSSDNNLLDSALIEHVCDDVSYSYLICGLSEGQTYTVHVKSQNAAGTGIPSLSAAHTAGPSISRSSRIYESRGRSMNGNSNEKERSVDPNETIDSSAAKDDVGTIVGIAVGCLAIVTLLSGLVIYYKKKNTKNQLLTTIQLQE